MLFSYLGLPLATIVPLCSGGIVTIQPTPRQTLTSFGASGAWWPNDLIHFPVHIQEQLAHFLFSKDGLYLSSYRYNMGGDGGNDTQEVTANGSRVESFLLRNGTYDWARDHAGVTFMRLAKQYSVPFITFFINAAPSHIATNGAACGWNMTANKVGEFADYVQTVLSHWISTGIDIKYVSPMNEPDNDRSDCSQEGMGVAPHLRPEVFKTLRSTLDKSTSADSVDIIGDETSQITTQAFPEYPHWLAAAAPSLSNIAVHNYDYPSDAALAEYYSLVQKLTAGGHAPAVKFTETCCSTTSGSGSDVFGAQYDPTMKNALIVGRYVWQFLTIVQAQSFDWWTAVTYLPCSPKLQGPKCATAINDTAGYNSGLVYIDPEYNQTHDYTLYFTKRAFMLKHFAYFHRPGSVRYDVSGKLPKGVLAVASKSPAETYGGKGDDNRPQQMQQPWNVLFMNNQTHAQELTLQVPSRGARLLQIAQTTPHVDWERVSQLPHVRNGRLQVKLPAQSFSTLQFVAEH